MEHDTTVKPAQTSADANHKPRVRAAGMWREVADQLQEQIVFGKIQPQQHLIEEEAMEAFGASRHAVRRAFEELERSGLVVRLPNRGARVRSYSATEVRDLYEIREALEYKAAQRYALPAPPQLIAELRRIAQRHRNATASGDIHELFRANNDFHEVFYGACGNQALAAAIRSYSWLTHPIRMRFITHKDHHVRAVEQHLHMIELLSGTDNEALASLCAEHLQPSKRFYLSMYGHDDAA